MHDPIDPMLDQLAAMPTPSAIAMLEARVFAAIDDRARSRRSGMWSVAVALALGLVGGGVVGSGVAPAQAATPIGMDSALAPSTLLLGR